VGEQVLGAAVAGERLVGAVGEVAGVVGAAVGEAIAAQAVVGERAGRTIGKRGPRGAVGAPSSRTASW
jgi:hypothetical protein